MNLQEISDRLEIQDLMVEYCYAIDMKNWDALDEVFTPDATIDYSEMVGFKGTLPEAKKFLAEGLAVMDAGQHIVSTSKIKIEGDRAYGRTICTNPMVFKPTDQFFCVGIWFRDEFLRTEKGWRISSRYEERSWQFNLPSELAALATSPDN